MSVHQCPFCHRPIRRVPIDFDLTIKQGELFRLVMNSGPSGISKKEIMEVVFKGRSQTTLRTCIHQINKAIHPLHIKGHNNIYKFVINKSE